MKLTNPRDRMRPSYPSGRDTARAKCWHCGCMTAAVICEYCGGVKRETSTSILADLDSFLDHLVVGDENMQGAPK